LKTSGGRIGGHYRIDGSGRWNLQRNSPDASSSDSQNIDAFFSTPGSAN